MRKITVECCQRVSPSEVFVIGFELMEPLVAWQRLSRCVPDEIIYRIRPVDFAVLGDVARHFQDATTVAAVGRAFQAANLLPENEPAN